MAASKGNRKFDSRLRMLTSAFKTDSSEDGPEKDSPAIVAAEMMGDRASVIFSMPEEIGRFIARHC